MVSGFICGTSKLPREEDDYERHTRSADSSPRRSSRSSKNNNNNNPYSTRGLEKFSSLLAEIEEKRQQIYSQVNPDEICVVRFEFSGDHEFKPIIVKAKQVKSLDNNDHTDQKRPSLIRKLQSSKSMDVKRESSTNKVDNKVINKRIKNNHRKLWRINQWRESLLVLPMIVILILVFLVLFGRSFAIMCTSIGWYVIPTITNKNASDSSSKKLDMSSKRKDYAIRRLSEKKLMTSEGTKLSFKNK